MRSALWRCCIAGIHQLQEKGESVDGSQEPDELVQWQVIDELDPVLDDIVVKELQGNNCEDVLRILPRDQGECDQGT